MEIAARLAEERRARLAAERLLELKQAELFAANRKLNLHARQLSHEITETRAEVATVRDENQRVKTQLGAAHQKIELVEGQLWTALACMRDGFATFNAERRMELANPAWLALFDGLDTIGPGAGYAHVLDMMVEEGIVDLQGEHGDDWRARMAARWEADPIPTETIRIYTGQFLQLQDRHLPDGGVVTLSFDITDLMRMWSALEELPDGFVIFDAEDRLLMCNETYREIYHASAEAIRPGVSFEDILRHGLARGQYREAMGREEHWLEERLSAHRGAERELEQQLGDGRWLRVYERPLTDGGRVGLRIDITEAKRIQQELEEARQRAETASHAKSTFLANMSHEIRTPMNGVVGMAALLMDSALSEEQRLYAETIRSSGEALLLIINDILDYSKIEADRMALCAEAFDLERAIHEVALLLQPAAREKGVALLVDYDPSLPAGLVGDAGRIRQILTNLVGNAVKFTAEGHVLIRVSGSAEAGRAALSLTVEDTGIGIARDKLDHIFGEFNQVEDARNRTFEGTGLGLAITRRLVEMMGGELWVDSELGEGACFGLRLDLPLAEAWQGDPLALPPGLRRALVVAAMPESRAILLRQLGALGLEAVWCASGDAALDHARAGEVDLVIAEQALPGLEGAELAQALAGGGPPVLLLSPQPASVPQGSGAFAVVQMPASRRSLCAALAGWDGHERRLSPPPPAKRTAPASGTGALDLLLAEDNRTNQLVFRKMAEALDLPLQLRFACDGAEAVGEFEARRPDLIFMDISMPGMDGKEATRRIREIEGDGPRVPIIAVTAHAMTGDREALIAAGLDDYLTKPLRKPDLARLIEKWSGPAAAQVSG
ncbi:PAS-domain containing protein [Alloyangia pacifica]|uniref:hybrid sensor histidine kinase/response regulator n=1 Tax=Alloyangia pacifica TaxID=311180 RepID=UPI001CD1CB25|nr:PAS-domain containing protein [Alloyangia pacifica]MCA0997587.1 PAS-domain containing protein [Alloyangia pacifica]